MAVWLGIYNKRILIVAIHNKEILIVDPHNKDFLLSIPSQPTSRPEELAGVRECQPADRRSRPEYAFAELRTRARGNRENTKNKKIMKNTKNMKNMKS